MPLFATYLLTVRVDNVNGKELMDMESEFRKAIETLPSTEVKQFKMYHIAVYERGIREMSLEMEADLELAGMVRDGIGEEEIKLKIADIESIRG